MRITPFAACPGFALKRCVRCRKRWMSTASETAVMTNLYCPTCIPQVFTHVLAPDGPVTVERDCMATARHIKHVNGIRSGHDAVVVEVKRDILLRRHSA